MLIKALVASVLIFYIMADVSQCKGVPVKALIGNVSAGEIKEIEISGGLLKSQLCGVHVDKSKPIAVFMCLVVINQFTFLVLIIAKHSLCFRRHALLVAFPLCALAFLCAFAKMAVAISFMFVPLYYDCNISSHSMGHPGQDIPLHPNQCLTKHAQFDVRTEIPGCNCLHDDDDDHWDCDHDCTQAIACHHSNVCQIHVQPEVVLLAISYFLSGTYLIYLSVAYYVEARKTNGYASENITVRIGEKLKAVAGSWGNLAALIKFVISAIVAIALLSNGILANQSNGSSGAMLTCTAVTHDRDSKVTLLSSSQVAAACKLRLETFTATGYFVGFVLCSVLLMVCFAFAIIIVWSKRLQQATVFLLYAAVVAIIYILMWVIIVSLGRVPVVTVCSNGVENYLCEDHVVNATAICDKCGYDGLIQCSDRCHVALGTPFMLLMLHILLTLAYFLALMAWHAYSRDTHEREDLNVEMDVHGSNLNSPLTPSAETQVPRLSSEPLMRSRRMEPVMRDVQQLDA
jgi:chromate transport protein ChrA